MTSWIINQDKYGKAKGSQFTWRLIAQQPFPIIVFSSRAVFLETTGFHTVCPFPAVVQGKTKESKQNIYIQISDYVHTQFHWMQLHHSHSAMQGEVFWEPKPDYKW